jgi:hypothetical protein
MRAKLLEIDIRTFETARGIENSNNLRISAKEIVGATGIFNRKRTMAETRMNPVMNPISKPRIGAAASKPSKANDMLARDWTSDWTTAATVRYWLFPKPISEE